MRSLGTIGMSHPSVELGCGLRRAYGEVLADSLWDGTLLTKGVEELGLELT